MAIDSAEYGDDDTTQPLAIAHRGGGLGPENTLAGFARSAALGIRYLETDVRLTRDGHLVCFHDATVDRVTDGRGQLGAHTLAELRTLRVAGRGQVATLSEALLAFPHARFTIDVKERAAVGSLAATLTDLDAAGRVCVAGAWDGPLDRLRQLAPGVRTALGWRRLVRLVVHGHTHTPAPRRLARGPFAHVPMVLGGVPVYADGLLTRAHAIGIRVIVWTVNHPDAMRRLLDAGVDGIITDRPDLLRDVLIERGQWSAPTWLPGPLTPA